MVWYITWGCSAEKVTMSRKGIDLNPLLLVFPPVILTLQVTPQKCQKICPVTALDNLEVDWSHQTCTCLVTASSKATRIFKWPRKGLWCDFRDVKTQNTIFPLEKKINQKLHSGFLTLASLEKSYPRNYVSARNYA